MPEVPLAAIEIFIGAAVLRRAELKAPTADEPDERLVP